MEKRGQERKNTERKGAEGGAFWRCWELDAGERAKEQGTETSGGNSTLDKREEGLGLYRQSFLSLDDAGWAESPLQDRNLGSQLY